ncbi:YrzI family small protein [Evansella clarkii]|jgi:uncharacterized protein (TIGR02413 family)|uniref:YrzI family small protein n=1 Tax=Evansella clarkii TaxID=79879 RepID=UPI0009974368|nr:YrzI family small protein [Evansella clarkii]
MMLFNLFFLTITVARRKHDGKDIERAYEYQESVKHSAAVRAKQSEYLNRLM